MGLVDVVDGIFVSFALGDRPHTKAYVFAINRINHPASTIRINHQIKSLDHIIMGSSPWIMALKIWNKDRDTWSIPRKGSEEYDEVREIMDYLREHPNFFKGEDKLVSEIEAVGPQTYGKKKQRRKRKD